MTSKVRMLKAAARGAATVLILPAVALHKCAAALTGRDRALEGSSQWMSLLPGLSGGYLRRAFLQFTIRECHPTAEISFGTLFSQSGAIIEDNAYIGPRCNLGLVHICKDVLIAAGVHIPSGGQTHFHDDPTKPIREQGGERKIVTIGAGAWIGSNAVVLADVGAGTIVGAGSVVTKPLPANVIAGGVPAKIIRPRFPTSPEEIPAQADDAEAADNQ